MKITHLGHACLLVEVADQRVLIDPGNFSDLDGLSGLTAVVVTHQHADHCDPQRLPALLQANPEAEVFVEPQVLDLADLGDRAQGMTSGQEFDLGALTVTPVGELHADNHPYVPRVGNLGVVLAAEGEPVLYHPGDALDADPGPVDLLCVPVSAPWGKVAEAIAFVRRVAPARGIIPIHDALLSDAGRKMYLKHIGDFGLEGGVEVLDLAGAGPSQI